MNFSLVLVMLKNKFKTPIKIPFRGGGVKENGGG
jgi:hypothetical protein